MRGKDDRAGQTPANSGVEATTGERRLRSIVLITNYYPVHGGGIEIVAGQLATRLPGGFDLRWHAAAPSGPPRPAVAAVRSMHSFNGIERHFGFPVPIPSLSAVFALIRDVRAADLVWAHDLIYPANLIALLAAGAARKPSVVTVHVGAIPYRSPFARRLMAVALWMAGRYLLTRATAVIFVSDRVRGEFRSRWRLRDGRLVPNGVDPTVFTPLTAAERTRVRHELGLGDGPVVLFVGRFVERKGLRLLRELAARTPAIDWLFAGRGPIDPTTWDLPNVHVQRDRSGRSLAELYGAADLFALPSIGEGFPLVVAEALAMGLAVLLDPSSIAGYPAVAEVAEGESVLGSDAVDRWAVRIDKMLDDTPGRVAGASHRTDFARSHWNWERAAGEYARLFGELLGEDAGAGVEPASPTTLSEW